MTSGTMFADMKFRIANGADKQAIRMFLQEVKLPTESVDTGVTTFYVGTEKGEIVGIAGFEFYGDDALLRSVAVRPKLQSRRIGSGIVDHMLSVARQRKMRRVVLLTETAQKFFERKGFKVINRSSITNGSMLKSTEFTVACPTSAVCMVFQL